jgi:hypothetical protein
MKPPTIFTLSKEALDLAKNCGQVEEPVHKYAEIITINCWRGI